MAAVRNGLLLVSIVFAGASMARSAAGAPEVSVTVNGVTQRAPDPAPHDDRRSEPRPPCDNDCFVLSHLALRGAVSGSMTFELRGAVRADEETRIPLFGPPGQVHLEDVTIDGAPARLHFDSDSLYVYTRARSFTVRGRMTLGTDGILSVPGPLVALDAHLTKGRLVEGEKLSGILGTVLHFDPMIDGAEAKPKVPPVFRLSRAIRVGRETSFVYRLVASQAADLGTIRLPLKNGEKVQDAQGSTGWTVEGTDLLLPTSGHDAEITISGTMTQPKSFTPDDRSAYEWLLVEADPEHRVAVAGEGKLVELSQSPIPPSYPGARVYLLQRGQHVDLDARSLVRGDVLAAVARSHQRFVALTGAGELIGDEVITYDNNGLDHLALTPAGRAVYLSNDGQPQRILKDDAQASEVLVPVSTGSHRLRVQTLSNVRIWPLAGALSMPSSTYPLSTSTVETTIGLPSEVHPIAVLGGDHVRWGIGRGDLVAVAVGIALACFGFRTTRSRALGSLATAGLWFVSREAFVVAGGALAVVGLVFLASRFLRGTRLLVASGFILSGSLLVGRAVLASDATGEPTREMFVDHPQLPTPESNHAAHATTTTDPSAVTPVSLSMPSSERYVVSSRQVVSQERPFSPRVVYVTSTLVGILHLAWLALVGALVFAHRDKLLALKAQIKRRLAARPAVEDVSAASVEAESPPF